MNDSVVWTKGNSIETVAGQLAYGDIVIQIGSGGYTEPPVHRKIACANPRLAKILNES